MKELIKAAFSDEGLPIDIRGVVLILYFVRGVRVHIRFAPLNDSLSFKV
tara:strand:+ start:300 stop:446 length:147 start_codon:yes stop_codon:yes gene_type:complete